jgi:superfamily II DNA helicase RecQ
MFQSTHFQSLSSVIIYTLFQNQADRLAAMLRISNIHAESFHSGKPIKDRQRIAKEFQLGHIKVIVGTISFGLGIDHPQVSSVIHYSLPKNIEHYVQVSHPMINWIGHWKSR